MKSPVVDAHPVVDSHCESHIHSIVQNVNILSVVQPSELLIKSLQIVSSGEVSLVGLVHYGTIVKLLSWPQIRELEG